MAFNGESLSSRSQDDLGRTLPIEQTAAILQWLLETKPRSRAGPHTKQPLGTEDAHQHWNDDMYE